MHNGVDTLDVDDVAHMAHIRGICIGRGARLIDAIEPDRPHARARQKNVCHTPATLRGWVPCDTSPSRRRANLPLPARFVIGAIDCLSFVCGAIVGRPRRVLRDVVGAWLAVRCVAASVQS